MFFFLSTASIGPNGVLFDSVSYVRQEAKCFTSQYLITCKCGSESYFCQVAMISDASLVAMISDASLVAMISDASLVAMISDASLVAMISDASLVAYCTCLLWGQVQV